MRKLLPVFWLAFASVVGAEGLTGTLADGKLKLTWPKVADADGYLVYKMERGVETMLGKTGENSLSVPGERYTLNTFEIRWKKEGKEVVAHRGVVGTFPKYYKTGEFSLDVFGRDTWRFEEDRNDPGHKGDIAIVRSMGGGSMITVRGIFGIESGTPGGFGKIDPARRQAIAEALKEGEIDVRETQPETMQFQLRSGEGALVHIRVSKCASPRATFEYVYVMRPEIEDIVAEFAEKNPAPLADKDRQEILAMMDRLVSADTNEKLTASAAIIAKGAPAVALIATQMKEHANPEVREKLEGVLRKIWEKEPREMK